MTAVMNAKQDTEAPGGRLPHRGAAALPAGSDGHRGRARDRAHGDQPHCDLLQDYLDSARCCGPGWSPAEARCGCTTTAPAARWTRSSGSSARTLSRHVFLANDPHHDGAMHPQDVFVMLPVFMEGRLIAWFASCAHMLDMGGIAIRN